MGLRFSVIAACVVLVLASCSTGTQAPPPSTSTVTITAGPPPSIPPPSGPAAATPVVGSVLAPPMPVPASDGKTHLAYELMLTNTMAQDVTLTSLAAVAGDRTVLTLSGDGVAYWTRIVGANTPTATIGPGQTALVWLDAAVDDATAIPTDISHTVGLSVPQPQPPLTEATITETVAPTIVDNRKPVTISPPLSGDNWVDANGCCDMTSHRMAVSPLNGQLWAPERYAIDYVQLTPDGRLFNGDKAVLANYPFYGEDVHAVADGQVVTVVNDLPEQVPGALPAGLPLDQYAGNRVIVDIGAGNYVMYAHLKTGSAKVNVGDRVTTGQTVGAVGNSGNTDAPHLHFQLMSAPEPLRSNGVPFVFDKFRLNGRIAADTGQAPDTPAQMQHGITARDETYRMPLDLDVMTFPAR